MLFVVPDGFTRVGGGETAVGNIARALPDWTFVNLTRTDATSVPGRANVELVPSRLLVLPGTAHALESAGSRWHRYDLEDAVAAMNTAWSVRGQRFDIVDVPDYASYGRFLPAAFELFGVDVGKFVQSLHGRVSNTYLQEWFKAGRAPNHYDQARQRAEDMSLNALDGRYAISEFYRRWLRPRTSLPIELVDPLVYVDIPDVDQLPRFSGRVPQLVFVSRLERQKAGDRFIELLWHLPQEAGARRLVIGNDAQLGGLSGRERVQTHQWHRHVDRVDYEAQLSPEDLRRRVFLQPSIVILPTRQDTFNLTALEAALHGCPIVLGPNCGAYEYLRDRLPGLPMVTFDEDDIPGTADRLESLIEHFDEARAEGLATVEQAALRSCLRSFVEAYDAPPVHDPAARIEAMRDFQDIRREISDSVAGLGAFRLPRLEGHAAPVPGQSTEAGWDGEVALLKSMAASREKLWRYAARNPSGVDRPVRL
ncbi:MAG TPA: glycosyltransferase family 4 protein, partial [Vicinamibacterales bacterium]|nr:glycosyltransferase family 4 protein [Vicinamibacterales bacterium]